MSDLEARVSGPPDPADPATDDAAPGGGQSTDANGRLPDIRGDVAAATSSAVVGFTLQLIERLTVWNRAFLLFFALSLALTVFWVRRARRLPAGGQRWSIRYAKPLASGGIAVATALAFGINALLGAIVPNVPPSRASWRQEFTLQNSAEDGGRVGSLRLEAGSYLIWAKMYVEGADELGSLRVTCRLYSGFDSWDETTVDTPANGRASLALGLAVTYPSATTAALSCRNVAKQTRTGKLLWIKILAIGIDSLDNTATSG
jgi:hypothetical protein